MSIGRHMELVLLTFLFVVLTNPKLIVFGLLLNIIISNSSIVLLILLHGYYFLFIFLHLFPNYFIKDFYFECSLQEARVVNTSVSKQTFKYCDYMCWSN